MRIPGPVLIFALSLVIAALGDGAALAQSRTPSLSRDPLAPKTDGSEANVRRLAVVTLCTTDFESTRHFYRDGMGLRERGPLETSSDTRSSLRALWGLPKDIDWTEYVYDRPSLNGVASVRVLVLSKETPQIRTRRSGQDEGSLSIGFAVSDIKKAVARLEEAGFGTTAGVSELSLKRPDTGASYTVEETHFKAPDNVYALGVARSAGMPPVGPIDPATGVGGPSYTGITLVDSNRFVAFLKDGLGFEIRRDIEMRTSGPLGGLALPEGTVFRFVQAFAPGSTTGYLVLLDMKDRSLPNPTPPRPPSRGIAMWTFEVRDIQLATERARAAGGTVVAGPTRLDRPPFGPHKASTTLAPGGLLIELVQRDATAR